MKRMNIVATAVAVILYLVPPMWAQHGHGMGQGMGHSMGTHGSLNTGHDSSPGQPTMQQKLSRNKTLSSKIAALTKMDAQTACQGFKNIGQCVAAAHVSKNLGLSFTCLKDNMLGIANKTCGTTAGKGMSLGKAIQTMDPKVNSKLEGRKGTKEASDDLKHTQSGS